MTISKIFDILVEICFASQNLHDFLDFYWEFFDFLEGDHRKIDSYPSFFSRFSQGKNERASQIKGRSDRPSCQTVWSNYRLWPEKSCQISWNFPFMVLGVNDPVHWKSKSKGKNNKAKDWNMNWFLQKKKQNYYLGKICSRFIILWRWSIKRK